MTTQEFSDQFDLLYDNIASKGAPGIDLYEKSVYLTNAQLELIKDYYDPKSNRKQTGFESTEKRRSDLRELIRDYKTSTEISTNSNERINNHISDKSSFFRLPSDVFVIIQEQASIFNTCSVGSKNLISVNIIPKTHDEYNIQIKNPFKKPDNSVIWRLDFYNQIGGTKNVELISYTTIKEYHLRYIKYPNPIILTDLTTGDFTGMNLTIDGKTNEQTCKLSQEIHREILNRAIELVTRDYKENNLQNKIQTNLRNE